MLTSEQKKQLNYIHGRTSIEVQAWIKERMDANLRANPWAEEQLKAFLRAYKQFGTGTQALRFLNQGNHEQQELDL